MEKQEIILEISDLTAIFEIKKIKITPVNNVSFIVHKNETVGIVGDHCLDRLISTKKG